MKHHAKKIFLCGYYGCGNLGDDALLHALLRALSEHAPNTDLMYLTGGASVPLFHPAELHAEAVSRTPCAVLRAIGMCDVLVLGGGSVLQNKTGQASLYAYLSLLSLAQRFGKRTAILAGGLGPIDGNTAKRSTASVLRRLDYASFRDADACTLAHVLGVLRPILSADPALLLCAEPCEIPLPKRFLLVSLREKTRIPIETAARRIFCIAERKQLTPVLCDLFPREDAVYTSAVAREVSRLYAASGRATAAWTLPYLSPEKLLSVTSRSEYVLTGRYHLALFAYASGVPFRILGDDPKLLSIARETRMPCETVRRAEEDISAFIRAVL